MKSRDGRALGRHWGFGGWGGVGCGPVSSCHVVLLDGEEAPTLPGCVVQQRAAAGEGDAQSVTPASGRPQRPARQSCHQCEKVV